jgi:cytochrome P450
MSARLSRSFARPQRTPNCGGAREEGDRVAMFYSSANRDETQFADPDRFDVSRTPNPHVAFGGGGTHFCLGANLARVEAAAILPEVLSRMKNLELAGRSSACGRR